MIDHQIVSSQLKIIPGGKWWVYQFVRKIKSKLQVTGSMLCVIRVLRWGDKRQQCVKGTNWFTQEEGMCVCILSLKVKSTFSQRYATSPVTACNWRWYNSEHIQRCNHEVSWSSDVNIRSCAATPTQLFSLIIIQQWIVTSVMITAADCRVIQARWE